MAWSYDGLYIVTTCKDKKVRVFDARTGDELKVSGRTRFRFPREIAS